MVRSPGAVRRGGGAPRATDAATWKIGQAGPSGQAPPPMIRSLHKRIRRWQGYEWWCGTMRCPRLILGGPTMKCPRCGDYLGKWKVSEYA